MQSIYVLRQEQGKFYVGSSLNVDERFAQHMGGRGSAWTQRYHPIEVVSHFEEINRFAEDNTVKEYMVRFGIDNVRGGSYSNIDLTDDQVSTLYREIRHSDDLCLQCGGDDHFVRRCPKRRSGPEHESIRSRSRSRERDNDSATQRQACRGISNTGRRCISSVFSDSNGYCQAHQNQVTRRQLKSRGEAPHRAAQEVSRPTSREVAVFTSRSQCLHPVNFNLKGYSQAHQDQATRRLKSNPEAPRHAPPQGTSPTCRGTANSGSQCRTSMYLNSEGYCQAHRGDHESSQGGNTRICRGTTQSGSRCQRTKYLNGEGYCQSHQDQADEQSNHTQSYRSNAPLPRQQQSSQGSRNASTGSQTCCGTTQSGSRCQRTNYLNGEGYCQSHQDQADEQSNHSQSYRSNVPPPRQQQSSQGSRNASTGSQTCCGTTQSGNRCQRTNYLNGEGYCQSHQDQADDSSYDYF